MTAPSALDLRERDERRLACRALLAQPFVGAEHPAFQLVRRHEAALARHLADFLGYRLHVTPGFARLFKRPTDAGLTRPWRIRPGSVAGRARTRDEWPALDRRRCVLLALTVAALERERRQTAIGELARGVVEAGARCELPIAVDLDRRPERLAFADVLDLLCAWGVLELADGSRRSFARAEQGDDEALFTIDRRRLASLLHDPFRLLQASSLEDVLAERDADYPPTEEGERRRVRHAVARRLVEDPACYLRDLNERERAYLISQGPALARTLERWSDLRLERRAEGAAAVEHGRELTDLPFPAGSARKQVALLLCDRLAATCARGESLSVDELSAEVRRLVARHGESWSAPPSDSDAVERLTRDAVDVLTGLGLCEEIDGGLRPLPLCARFRGPAVRVQGGAAIEREAA